MQDTGPNSEPDPGAGRWRWVLTGFLAVATFFLWTEHRAHLLGALPYLLILTCPLMHLFMHGGHGQHGRHGPGSRDAEGTVHASRNHHE